MLTIAGGVIIGILGLWAILALIGVIAENAEDIAQGCAVVVGVIALIGAWAFLDEMWPEIDWIKTAFAAVGGGFAAFVAMAMIWDSGPVRKLRSKGALNLQSKEEVSPPDEVEEAIYPAPPVSTQIIEVAKPQAAPEPIAEESEQEWRARVARELRLSRQPKWPRMASKSYLDKDTEELFSAYVKWKDTRTRDEDGS